MKENNVYCDTLANPFDCAVFIGDYKQVFSAHFCNEDLLWLFCSCKILNELCANMDENR